MGQPGPSSALLGAGEPVDNTDAGAFPAPRAVPVSTPLPHRTLRADPLAIPLSRNADNLGVFGWFEAGRGAVAGGSAPARGGAARASDGGWLGRPDDDDRLG
jgi:hypothetical protein